MIRKWLSIFALIAAAISLLSVSSCGDPQELISITVQPSVETIGNSSTPVQDDAGSEQQLRALGSYIHPPVTKDITTQVTWASNDTQMFTVSSTGLLRATGEACGGTLVSATVTTNHDGSGLSSSGAIVTGYMTANVTCFTGTGSGGNGGGEPVLTVNFLGNGTGVVANSNSTVNCPSTAGSCVNSFPTDTAVTLDATPISPSTFGGWSNGCTGTGACNIVMHNDTTVTATFN